MHPRSNLRQRLREQLAQHFGKPRSIGRLRSRRSPYTSSFRIDELTVGFADGAALRVILKDLSADAMLEAARRARPAFMTRPQREINAYRWILPFAPAGVPICFGSVVDREADRYWLFLERVVGSQLTLVGDFMSWQRTAAWIAAFHAAFPGDMADRLARHADVLIYDEAFYWLWLQRAQRFAERDRHRREGVALIARHYAAVVARLLQMPATLIHGELYAGNVIVGGTSKRLRICPVDWEMSALGPGLIDLAALSAGWLEQAQLALARAYLAGDDHAGAPSQRLSREFLVDLDCCRLLLAMRMLGWSNHWVPPRQHAHDWLAEAVRLSNRLRHLTPSTARRRARTLVASKTSSASPRAARA